MKIIFHLTDHLPEYHQPWGGAEKVAYRHLSSLIDYQKGWKFYVGTVKPLKKIEEKFHHVRIWTIEDFFPKKLHLYVTGFKNQVFPFDPIAFFSVLVTAIRIKPDLIHIHKANKISFAPIIVGRLLKIPVVLAIYDYWYFCPGAMLIDAQSHPCHKFHGIWCRECSGIERFGPVAKFAAFFRKPLFDFFLNRVDRFLVLSEHNVQLLKEYGIDEKKIFVVRQPFNVQKFKEKVKVEKGKIFLNAWMAPHKGAHIVVAAMPYVLKKVPYAKLDIETKTLEPSYEKNLRKLIKKLGIENKVSIFDRITVETYLRNIVSSEVVVVAEQWENMAPTTLADAMSLGRPVVASDIGGLPEMVRDGKSGLLANAHNPQDFAKKIVELMKNPSFASKLGKQAILDIKNFGSEKKIKKQMFDLYQSISTKLLS